MNMFNGTVDHRTTESSKNPAVFYVPMSTLAGTRQALVESNPEVFLQTYDYELAEELLQPIVAETREYEKRVKAKADGVKKRLIAEGEGSAPAFLLAAEKDPLEADLERIQIVKGWLSEGRPLERVYDVVCADGQAPDPVRHRCTRSAAPPDPRSCR